MDHTSDEDDFLPSLSRHFELVWYVCTMNGVI